MQPTKIKKKFAIYRTVSVSCLILFLILELCNCSVQCIKCEVTAFICSLNVCVISVQNRFADRKLVGAMKPEVGMEVAGGSDSVETTDDMSESLSLDQPSSSRVATETFRSSRLKNRHALGRKKWMKKKK
jgi:hypothetical protein